MKKLSVVVLVLLSISMVSYGATGNWEDNDSLPETWMTTGNVGIGTSSPGKKLDVSGDIRVSSDKYVFFGSSAIKRYDGMYGGLQFYCDMGPMITMTSSYVGIGTSSPTAKLHVDGNSIITGKLGIGTTSCGSYELAVDGEIRAKEIKVETGWSDFVFADDYSLMPLDKLEKHIKVNKSLPGIPTEKEVLAGGVNLGEMQAKFLEKIEELTLYVIEQNKKISELEGKIARLEAEK